MLPSSLRTVAPRVGWQTLLALARRSAVAAALRLPSSNFRCAELARLDAPLNEVKRIQLRAAPFAGRVNLAKEGDRHLHRQTSTVDQLDELSTVCGVYRMRHFSVQKKK